MKKQKNYTNSWMNVGDLLLSIQADFQNKVYDAIVPYPKKFQEEILSGVHILFTRFYFSALQDKEGVPCPYDIVVHEREEKHVIIPSQTELAILLRRSPIKNAATKRRIRMYVGLMQWEDFPIVQNILNKNIPLLFPNDLKYIQLVHTLLMKEKLTTTPEKLFQEVITTSLEIWRKNDEVLSKVFSKEGWTIFWHEYLRDAAKGVVLTDDLFDVFFRQLKKTGIQVDFIEGMLNHQYSEFDAISNKQFAQQIPLYFQLTCNYATYFLFPLSVYFPVLSLFYVEPVDIFQEIDDYKEVFPHESFCNWLAKPASEFTLTDFGKELISKWK